MTTPEALFWRAFPWHLQMQTSWHSELICKLEAGQGGLSQPCLEKYPYLESWVTGLIGPPTPTMFSRNNFWATTACLKWWESHHFIHCRLVMAGVMVGDLGTAWFAQDQRIYRLEDTNVIGYVKLFLTLESSWGPEVDCLKWSYTNGGRSIDCKAWCSLILQLSINICTFHLHFEGIQSKRRMDLKTRAEFKKVTWEDLAALNGALACELPTLQQPSLLLLLEACQRTASSSQC